jgi:hypothetical protein
LKLPFRLPRLGLLARVILGLAAVGFIPLAIVPYLLALNSDAFSTQVLKTHAVTARTTGERIAAFVDGIQASAHALALNPDIYAGLDRPMAREIVASYLQAQPAVVGVQATSAQGGEHYRVQRKEYAGIVETVLANPSAEDIVPVNVNNAFWLRIKAEMPEDGGHLRLVVNGAQLRDVVNSPELGLDAAVLVVSQDRDILFASDPKVSLSSFPSDLVQAGLSGRAGGARRFVTDDGAVLGASAQITGTRWFVLTRQPGAVAEATQRNLRRNGFLAAAVALGLTAILSGFAYRSVVRPIRDLAKSQRRLAGLGRSAEKGNEIEQLKASFAALERQTLDREAIGDVFLGRYQVMGVVGNGGMGTVFRGYDPKLQRMVALKTIRIGDADTHRNDRVTSLLHEAVTVARFSHPNIVAVYDVEDIPEATFVAMEFVDGFSLDEHLARLAMMPPEHVVPIMASVARGLHSAHEHGVIHRDMKPGNVLLGRDGCIKVTDFGIASLRTSARKVNDLVFGTPGYLAPETIRGEGQDERGDVFAVGVVLYQCLTGEMPFIGRESHDILMSTLTDKVVPPSRRNHLVPLDLDALVAELMDKDRARRVPSAMEAALRLERLIRVHGWQWTTSALPTSRPGEDRASMSTIRMGASARSQEPQGE